MTKILMLGVGNSLLRDEGVGIHVLNALRRDYPDLEGVRYIDGGTLSFTLFDEIADADALVVLDAAILGEAPGSVRFMIDADMDAFLGKGKLSVHEVGIADLLDMARLHDCLPSPRALVGIQPRDLHWGLEPSPQVAACVPGVVAQVVELIDLWTRPECMARLADAV